MFQEQRACADHFFIPPDYFGELRKEDVFPGDRPLELDVGCGDGGFLLAMAQAHPDRDFLGIERLLGRARKICRKAERSNLANVKVLRLESAYTLEFLLPVGCATRLHLLFPDPWPKKRHHDRRLVRAANVAHFARVLAPGGEWFFKTDHEEYFEEARAVIRESGWFAEREWNEPIYPETDFEKSWLAQGKPIHQACFEKRITGPSVGS